MHHFAMHLDKENENDQQTQQRSGQQRIAGPARLRPDALGSDLVEIDLLLAHRRRDIANAIHHILGLLGLLGRQRGWSLGSAGLDEAGGGGQPFVDQGLQRLKPLPLARIVGRQGAHLCDRVRQGGDGGAVRREKLLVPAHEIVAHAGAAILGQRQQPFDLIEHLARMVDRFSGLQHVLLRPVGQHAGPDDKGDRQREAGKPADPSARPSHCRLGSLHCHGATLPPAEAGMALARRATARCNVAAYLILAPRLIFG
jgi:hypothetical protein